MANPIASEIHRTAGWSMGLSILMILAGLLAIGLPAVAGVAITAIVAWLLVFSGLLHLGFAWRADSARSILGEILLGIVYGAIGLYILMHPVAGLASLTLALGAYLLVEGILEFVLAFQLRPARGSGWLLVDGIITLILAAMIWTTWPSSSAWVIGTIVGISMLFSGITRLMLSMAVRRAVA